MNILVYTQCFAPKLGGIESVMTNIASHAAALDHNVKVLADGSKYLSSKFDKNQKFETYRFDQIKFLRNFTLSFLIQDQAHTYQKFSISWSIFHQFELFIFQ